MTDDDRSGRVERPAHGPSTPPDLRFNPIATALGVFFAVAIPFVVVGYTRPTGVSVIIIAVGVVAGLLVGAIVGVWVERRGGQVWTRSRL